jgi:pimeloyl-ACP methyl ester carboxylesterase
MAGWAERDVRTNGITIHYLRTGGARPPIVLLHGLTDNGACWSRLAAALAPDYDVIMPDARGHGCSNAPPGPYTTDDHAADILGLIAALGLERPVLIGHSMGGLAAALVGARAPDQIRGVALEDPAFRSSEEWAERAVGDWPSAHTDTLALNEGRLIAQCRAENPTWSPDTYPLWARAKLQTRPAIFSWLATPKPDPSELVAHIGVPTLLITGDPARGAIVAAPTAARLCCRNPLVQVAHIPKVGHCIRYEQPERFASVVRAFLAELPR